MRIVMFMTWEGVKLEQYEKVRKLVDWEGNKPEGAVLHIASADSKGLRITDIWESEGELNSFVENRLMPKVRQIGVKSDPKVEIFPLHNLYTPLFVEK